VVDGGEPGVDSRDEEVDSRDPIWHVIPYGMRVPVAVRRVANCYTPFTLLTLLTLAYVLGNFKTVKITAQEYNLQMLT